VLESYSVVCGAQMLDVEFEIVSKVEFVVKADDDEVVVLRT